MKRPLFHALALIVCSACSQEMPQSPNNLTAPSPSGPSPITPSISSLSVPLNFRAHLSGDQVVPPRDTLAQGEAIFQLSRDGSELSFRVIVSNIENVTSAHLHLGAAGVNGGFPVFLLLYPQTPGGGRSDGVLTTGTIGDPIPEGPMTGQPLSVLIDAIEQGNAYVDIPTNDGDFPGNTGPGDFPGGELRGQLH